MNVQNQTKNAQFHCTIKIEYNESIRCIDLENTLSGVRMICQYLLAEKTELKTRDFTDVVKIQSIEKGSIVINLIFDLVQFNIDILQGNNYIDLTDEIIDLIKAYAEGELTVDKLKMYISWIITSIKNFKNFILEDDHKTTDINFKDGNLEIRNKEKL